MAFHVVPKNRLTSLSPRSFFTKQFRRIDSRTDDDVPANSDAKMLSFVLKNLQMLGGLSGLNMAVLEDALSKTVRRIEAGQDIIAKNETVTSVYVVLDGWAYRYKTLSNGRRQIVSYLIPGDVTDLNLFVRPRLDHTLASITSLSLAELPFETIESFFDGENRRITRAFCLKSLISASVQREWTVNLGQRSAPERLGHILCELFHRLRAVGLVDGHQCYMPLTQSYLADATGLSLVHVNKRLQDLRAAGLIVLRGKTLSIPSLEDLEKASLFNPDYLSLEDRHVRETA